MSVTPVALATVIEPVVAVEATVAFSCVEETGVMALAATPLNFTAEPESVAV